MIEIFQKKRALRLDWVYKTFYGWLAIPFASLALIITVIYVLVVFNAIKQRRVSRKCYILLLNRAIGDILACITCLIGAGYVLLSEKANRDVVSVMDTFFIASFWSAMVSYVSLSVLKLYAVARPFNYRRAVTMKRCIHLMIFSWVVFLFMVGYALTMTALVKVPVLNEWSGCKMETCLRMMYRSRNFVTITVYFFTIISFFITALSKIFLLYPASTTLRRLVPPKPRQPRRRTPSHPLSPLETGSQRWHLWIPLHLLRALGNPPAPKHGSCFFQRNFAEMMRILGLIRLTLLIRILIDPVISFITDFQIRRGTMELFRIKSRKIGMDSRNKIFQKSSSEENSSSNNNGQSIKASNPPEPRTQSVKTIA
ncbi:hypothetical protein L596_021275 [Steinernema carpocapsae]|uniref:G-protein coupled receptors family 1 profile domain-containing protein n=1 Tax=Steinernema carpocapsae TaxID=34508 RepID=A0A4V5ZZX4_STECR|nr:hypothetical protein L596_021275 [Steinernema carpocapsae]